jgi:type I restriction enzyme S subunit
MSEWRECKLSEVAEKFAMGPFGSNIKAENFTNHGVPVIRGTNLNYYKYVGGDFVYLTEEKADQLKSSNCFPNDIVITHRGTLGQAGLIPNGKYERYVISQSGMKVTVNPELLNSEFLLYFFKSNQGQYELLKNESQVGVPSISSPLTSLKSVELNLPPLPEQKAIAAVLSSLDDKIDLLHRQNKTLEAMAETLFKQWFVVEVREDWEEKPLSQVANFLNGLACQKYPPENEIDKLPVLKIRELNSGISESSDWASSTIKPEYIVENGDVIFAWSASLMVKVWHGETCILNQHLFKVTSTEFPKWFYLMWCKHHLDEFISISSSHATTMGHIKRGDLDNAMVLIPMDDELEIMTLKMTPILNKQIANQKQIQTLETLRDNLLPKLMSGEVRVNLA